MWDALAFNIKQPFPATTLYYTATTRGGISNRRELNVEVRSPCTFTISPSVKEVASDL
jgi:hypothetical protein